MALNMRPSQTTADKRDVFGPTPELTPERGVSVVSGGMQPTYLQHVFSREFGGVMFFTTSIKPMPVFNRVGGVLFGRDPFKIFKAIIAFVKILVVGDHTFRARANKRFKDQDMNGSMPDGFTVQTGNTVSAIVRAVAQYSNTTELQRTHAPTVANFIIGVSSYWLPCFFCHVDKYTITATLGKRNAPFRRLAA